jgi:hypothetical protein
MYLPAAPSNSGVAYIPNPQPVVPPRPLANLTATDQPLPPTPAYPQTWNAAPQVDLARFQAEPRPGAPGTVAPYKIQLEPPGLEKLAEALQTEAALQERIRQENRLRNIMEPVTFPESPVLSTDVYNGRAFEPRKITVAPNYTVYRRLLFQQNNFERYGWDLGILGPPLSAVAFLYDFVMLPYHLGTDPHRCMDSNAGYCLPGDPVPLLLYPEELSLTGTALQVGSILFLVAAFP